MGGKHDQQPENLFLPLVEKPGLPGKTVAERGGGHQGYAGAAEPEQRLMMMI